MSEKPTLWNPSRGLDVIGRSAKVLEKGLIQMNNSRVENIVGREAYALLKKFGKKQTPPLDPTEVCKMAVQQFLDANIKTRQNKGK